MQHAFFDPARAWQCTERRPCMVFSSKLCGYGEQPVSVERGVLCAGVGGGESHFVCDECLVHVTTFLQRDLRQLRASEGHVSCPGCLLARGQRGGTRGTAYPDQQLATHLPCELFSNYLRLRLKLTEQQLAEQFDQQLRAAVEAERQRLLQMDEQQRKVREARQHVTEKLLNLHCPRCSQVFVDFSGCCALTCSRCPCAFCAWCGKDCGADAHSHVAHCNEKPPGHNDVFATADVWRGQQRQRRQRLVSAYLNSLDVSTRQAVRQEMQRDLAELQLTG
eukprot:GGOE01049141.1.p2 GENE.GGOE01049141.1~~GGOE01049141.1.p2  ORF type:complete len:278 (+),score=67.21 GGOE01049141.1:54-887(+)